MSHLPRCKRWPVWGAALILLTGPLGSGGRDADVLLLHQVAITALALVVAWSTPAATILTGRSAWILAALVTHGILVADYKYSAGLALMDWISAAMLFGIVAGSREARSVGFILGAVVGAASLNALVLLVRGSLGLGFRGLFTNLHHGATLMAASSAMLLVWAVLARGRARLAHSVAAVTLALLVVALGSRGGMLGLAAGCGVGLVIAGRARAVLALLALLALTLAVPNPLRGRLF